MLMSVFEEQISYVDKKLKTIITNNVLYALTGINYKPNNIEGIFLVFDKRIIEDYNNLEAHYKLKLLNLMTSLTATDKNSPVYYSRGVYSFDELIFNAPYVIQTESTDTHYVYMLLGMKDVKISNLRKFVKNNFTKYRLNILSHDLEIGGRIPRLRIEKSDMTFMTLMDQRIEKDELLSQNR